VRPDCSGRTLAANRLAIAVFRQLAAVMYQETTRTRELVSLPRDDPEGQLFVGQIGAGQLQRLRACSSCRLSSVSSSSVFRGLS
jgi:hypothetical protein